jgi:hypothetical protein
VFITNTDTDTQMKFNIATLLLLVTVASARVMNVARRLDEAVVEENEFAFWVATT